MSIKVLYVGHVFEDSGYGRACQNYALALDSVGVDVVVRPVIFNKGKNIPNRILELCDKSTNGCNVQIQFLLPEYTEYDGRFDKNIVIFEKESVGLKYNGWSRRINLFDEVWVSNKVDQRLVQEDGITKPVFTIPHPCNDLIVRDKKIDNDELNSTYTFYFIGEHSKRKNLTALLRAYYTEFRRNEPVSLLLKVNKPGYSPEQLRDELQSICNEIKKGLKLYKSLDYYKKVIIIPNFLSEEDLSLVHATGDCFVSASCGEAWQYPAFEAMAYGNEVLANGNGPKEFLPDFCRFPKTIYKPCFGANDTLHNLHTSKEKWEEVDVENLGECMRQIYGLKPKVRQRRKEVYISQVEKFSFNNVGNLIKGRLENG